MGMGHMGMGHSGFGRPGFSHRVAFHHDHFRHRFFRNQFVFAAAPYGYYDDDCYIRVRTRWGWRLRSVCY
jgi:hypothetical protein